MFDSVCYLFLMGKTVVRSISFAARVIEKSFAHSIRFGACVLWEIQLLI